MLNRRLKTMLGTAVGDRVLRSNPCQIRGASTEHIAERPLLTVPQVTALTTALPEHASATVTSPSPAVRRFERHVRTSAGVMSVSKRNASRTAVASWTSTRLVNASPRCFSLSA